MLRSFSFRSNKDKKKGVDSNGTTNGVAPSAERRLSSRRLSSFLTNGTKKDEDEPSNNGAAREDVNQVFNQFAQVLHASRRPLPNQTGDGSYIDKPLPSGFMADLRSVGFKDLKTLKDVMESKAKGELVDDKSYLMERIIQLVAGLPEGSKTRNDLTNSFIDELWNSLQHPPLS